MASESSLRRSFRGGHSEEPLSASRAGGRAAAMDLDGAVSQATPVKLDPLAPKCPEPRSIMKAPSHADSAPVA